jgi:hypothetical protein
MLMWIMQSRWNMTKQAPLTQKMKKGMAAQAIVIKAVQLDPPMIETQAGDSVRWKNEIDMRRNPLLACEIAPDKIRLKKRITVDQQSDPNLLFEDLFVVGCEALFVVWVGKVYLTLSYDQAVSSGLHDFG